MVFGNGRNGRPRVAVDAPVLAMRGVGKIYDTGAVRVECVRKTAPCTLLGATMRRELRWVDAAYAAPFGARPALHARWHGWSLMPAAPRSSVGRSVARGLAAPHTCALARSTPNIRGMACGVCELVWRRSPPPQRLHHSGRRAGISVKWWWVV